MVGAADLNLRLPRPESETHLMFVETAATATAGDRTPRASSPQMTTYASSPISVRATLSAASIDVFGLFGRALPHISTVSDPNAPTVSIRWVFPAAIGSATKWTSVASNPRPAIAKAAATLAF